MPVVIRPSSLRLMLGITPGCGRALRAALGSPSVFVLDSARRLCSAMGAIVRARDALVASGGDAGRRAGVAPRLLPIPVWLLQAAASMLGKGAATQRLCGNLQVDISKARARLGWTPPISVDEGLRRVIAKPS